jgi:hypothetical protein
LGVGELTWERLDEFLVERRATHASRYTPRAPRPLLSFLLGLGVRPAEGSIPPGPDEVVAILCRMYDPAAAEVPAVDLIRDERTRVEQLVAAQVWPSSCSSR